MEKERKQAMKILSVLENYLDYKGVVIEYEDDYDCDNDNDNPANLRGPEYYDLEDSIVDILKESEE